MQRRMNEKRILRFQSLSLIIASYLTKRSANSLLTNDLIEHDKSFSLEIIRLII